MSTTLPRIGTVLLATLVLASTDARGAAPSDSRAQSPVVRLAQTRGAASSPVTFRTVPAHPAELSTAFEVPADWITEDPRLNHLIPRVLLHSAIDQWMAAGSVVLHCYRVFAAAADLPIGTLRTQITELGGTMAPDGGAGIHATIGSTDLTTSMAMPRTTELQICTRVTTARLQLAARSIPLSAHVRGLVDMLGAPTRAQYDRTGGPDPFGSTLALESTTMHFRTSPAVWRRAVVWLRAHQFEAAPDMVFTARADGIEYEVQNREGTDILVSARHDNAQLATRGIPRQEFYCKARLRNAREDPAAGLSFHQSAPHVHDVALLGRRGAN